MALLILNIKPHKSGSMVPLHLVLDLVQQQIRQVEGLAPSGTITDDRGETRGTWTYAKASSPLILSVNTEASDV